MKFVTSAICKQGGREYNQDFVASYVQNDVACLTVCDGLGSYYGSEVASRLCATHIVETYAHLEESDRERAFRPEFLQACVQSSHNYVTGFKEENPQLKSSCTTVACVATDCTHTAIAHIGDTRVYVFIGGKLVAVTRDHSLAQVAVDMGQIAQKDVRVHKDQNKLTRVLGSDYYTAPDTIACDAPLSEGDGFILCTDGFWEYVFDEEMEADFLANPPDVALAKMEARLLARIGQFNDNYSAIVAKVTV